MNELSDLVGLSLYKSDQIGMQTDHFSMFIRSLILLSLLLL